MYCGYIEERRDDSTYNILFAGSISENKGQWDAIKAIKILVDEGFKQIRLYIIGSGTERFLWIMKKYIEMNGLTENITILTFCDNLSEWRKKCSISITGSKMEALGRVTIEALFSGQIAIGANTGGTAEVIGDDGSRGILYEYGNADSLADAIKKVVQMDAFQRKEIMARAYTYATNTFAVKDYAKKLLDIYHVTKKAHRQTEQKTAFIKELQVKFEAVQIHGKQQAKQIELDKSMSKKLRICWNKIENEHISLGDYFIQNGYSKIAIYGMGHFGCRLYDELEKKGLEINYVIDQNAGRLSEIVQVREVKEGLEGVDVIVVTVTAEENRIITELQKHGNIRVIGLSEVIDNSMQIK